jgi:hypothetical protein
MEKTLEIHLKELREQIAQELEALMCDPFDCQRYPLVNTVECTKSNRRWEIAARIARGRYK